MFVGSDVTEFEAHSRGYVLKRRLVPVIGIVGCIYDSPVVVLVTMGVKCNLLFYQS